MVYSREKSKLLIMKKENKQEPIFEIEKALDRLKVISDQLQSGVTSLDDSIHLFREAKDLIERTRKELEKTDLQIHKLISTGEGVSEEVME
jgi:exodeoxyribonuclease VII small subunit